MRRTALALTLCCIAAPSLAQQQQSTAPERMAIYYAQCVLSFEKRADEMAALEKKLSDAQARIKELEPKKDEPK